MLGFSRKKAATIEDVKNLYECILDRPMENDGIYKDAWKHLERDEVARRLLNSDEFRRRRALDLLRLDVTLFFTSRFGFKFPLSLLEPMTILAYADSIYEREESDFVASHLGRGDVCIDLGARHGWFTGIMAQAVGPEGLVYSFEPCPPAAGVRQLVEANDFDNVMVIDAGAGLREERLRFDGASLSQDVNGAQSILVRPVDDVCLSGRRVALIKADIEGAEPAAFAGAARLIERDHPILVFEIHRKLLQQVSGLDSRSFLKDLEAKGYTSFQTLSGEPVCDDVLDREVVNLVARP